MTKKLFAFVLVLLVASCAFGETIKLPEPEKSGGMSLNEAITLRRSEREFADVDISLQELSNLLYVTAGVNRPESGLRVYPVALSLQDTFVYVFNREGVYKFDALTHSLELIMTGDHRQDTGEPEFVGRAAINLVFVHDMSLWADVKAPKEILLCMGFSHTGAAMQNAYLFAAAHDWSCVVRGEFDAEKLSKLLKLPEGQSITLVQSIGPKK